MSGLAMTLLVEKLRGVRQTLSKLDYWMSLWLLKRLTGLAFISLTFCSFTTIQANIHSFLESDDRINVVVKYLDEAVGQLDSMDSLVSSYKIHLNVRRISSNGLNSN
jgi:hypothetical protein